MESVALDSIFSLRITVIGTAVSRKCTLFLNTVLLLYVINLSVNNPVVLVNYLLIFQVQRGSTGNNCQVPKITVWHLVFVREEVKKKFVIPTFEL